MTIRYLPCRGPIRTAILPSTCHWVPRLSLKVCDFFSRFVTSVPDNPAVVTIKYVCPFCDQPLGPRKVEWFENLKITTLNTYPKLVASMWKKTAPNPRLTNPQGRHVPEALKRVQKVVCEQHRYETLILPLSIQYSWPRRPDFYRLLGYLFDPAIEPRVQYVYENPTSGLMIGDPSRRLESTDAVHLISHMSSLPLLGAG